MPDPRRNMRQVLLLIGIAWALFYPITDQMQLSVQRGGALSPYGDGFSEANALRAAESYVANGFLANAGLPVVSYGSSYPSTGFSSSAKGHNFVYTHYPPGPDLVLGVLAWYCGVKEVARLRLCMIVANLTLILVAVALFARALGSFQAVFILLGAAQVPVFTNFLHGLHYQGTALSLLLLQVALLVSIFVGVIKRYRCALFLVAFVEGFFSFDYFFLVVLAAIPVRMACRVSLRDSNLRRLMECVALAAAGFIAAHLVHLGQVSLHYGNVRLAIDDLLAAADARSLQVVRDKPIHTALELIWSYFWRHPYDARYFGNLLLAPLGLLWLFWLLGRSGRLTVSAPLAAAMRWRISLSAVLATLAALAVCMLWIVIMQGHALEHTHFLPRNLFLFYATPLIALASAFRTRRPKQEEMGWSPLFFLCVLMFFFLCLSGVGLQ